MFLFEVVEIIATYLQPIGRTCSKITTSGCVVDGEWLAEFAKFEIKVRKFSCGEVSVSILIGGLVVVDGEVPWNSDGRNFDRNSYSASKDIR
jgi:hypothetical protein